MKAGMANGFYGKHAKYLYLPLVAYWHHEDDVQNLFPTVVGHQLAAFDCSEQVSLITNRIMVLYSVDF
jgi:hypothetical protein